MEALTISAANLNVIEENLGAVAKELSGVITNVSDVNSHVNDVENKVADLNNEVKNLVKEIRETTIVTNARQNIMYNRSQIEKKFGYYDKLRRTTTSLIDAILHSDISVDSLYALKEDILLNNPNYWLANALAALTCWLLDDKENAYKELNNSMRKNEEKTAIFFCLVNLKLDRIDSSIKWLNKYLSLQSPLNLDKDFISILDLVTTGIFGDEEKDLVLKQLKVWMRELKGEQRIQDSNVEVWKDFISEYEEDGLILPAVSLFVTNRIVPQDNMRIASTYSKVLNELEIINNTESKNDNIDSILETLIYEFEDQEKIFEKDNLKNNLIIECNGDTALADKLYKKQERIYSDQIDLVSLLTNIVIYKEFYKISEETRKFALALSKENLINAYEKYNMLRNNSELQIDIDGFKTRTIDGKNTSKMNEDLDIYINNLFDETDKDLLIILIVTNILGIIGIFITLNSKIITFILVALIAIINITFFMKMANRTRLRNSQKKRVKENNSRLLERLQAEIIDYNNYLKNNDEQFERIKIYLNSLDASSFIKSNNERNINIGG